MATSRHHLQFSFVRSQRQVEKEGFLRMFPIALAVLIPGLAVAYLEICHMRLGYEMREIQERIRKEDELTRALELERSRLSRQEVVQKWATENGFAPAKATNLVHRPFTQEDQRLAKLRPVPSA